MMNYFVILFFASSSTSPQGYFPLPQLVLYHPLLTPLQYASTATLCALPPCPEPIRADDPLQAVLDYDCKATGFFPDQESGCQKFFQCVQQGDNLRAFQFTCGPELLFDTGLGVCNRKESVLDC
eukprot:TRINITY_DN4218_c0_g1_i1.p1 TRINITY_DN4218_c0_g1~~TRINITY_DN4218_c0_g1_i1.p1  ORF type:complete len:124 (-),score=35.00 TRINITY_DN4218_c0_g1_i1:85-456(-)